MKEKKLRRIAPRSLDLCVYILPCEKGIYYKRCFVVLPSSKVCTCRENWKERGANWDYLRALALRSGKERDEQALPALCSFKVSVRVFRFGKEGEKLGCLAPRSFDLCAHIYNARKERNKQVFGVVRSFYMCVFVPWDLNRKRPHPGVRCVLLLWDLERRGTNRSLLLYVLFT